MNAFDLILFAAAACDAAPAGWTLVPSYLDEYGLLVWTNPAGALVRATPTLDGGPGVALIAVVADEEVDEPTTIVCDLAALDGARYWALLAPFLAPHAAS